MIQTSVSLFYNIIKLHCSLLDIVEPVDYIIILCIIIHTLQVEMKTDLDLCNRLPHSFTTFEYCMILIEDVS